MCEELISQSVKVMKMRLKRLKRYSRDSQRTFFSSHQIFQSKKLRREFLRTSAKIFQLIVLFHVRKQGIIEKKNLGKCYDGQLCQIKSFCSKPKRRKNNCLQSFSTFHHHRCPHTISSTHKPKNPLSAHQRVNGLT